LGEPTCKSVLQSPNPLLNANILVNGTPTTGRRSPRRANTSLQDSVSTARQDSNSYIYSGQQLLSPTRILNHVFESTSEYRLETPPLESSDSKLELLDSPMLQHSGHSDLDSSSLGLSRSSGLPMTAGEDSYGALINQVEST